MIAVLSSVNVLVLIMMEAYCSPAELPICVSESGVLVIVVLPLL